MATKTILKEQSEIEQKANNYDNMIKVGTFQLQTKSFWIGLVSILVLFMLLMNYMTNHFWSKVCHELIELNKITNQYYDQY